MRRSRGDVSGRIALVAHRLAAPTATGVGRYNVELTRAIAERDDARRFVLVSAAEREAVTWLPPGLEVVRLPGNRRLLHTAWAATEAPTLDRLIGRPSLVHVLSPFVPVPTAAPTVWTVHDVMPFTNADWFRRWERWGFRRAAQSAARNARRIITPSGTTAAQVIERLKVPAWRVSIVPYGVSDAFRTAVPAARSAEVCGRYGVERDRYVVMVGALSSRKNPLVVLKALKALAVRPDGRSLTLLLAGPTGQGGNEVLDEVRRLGLDPFLRLAGYVPDDDLPALVSSALALVHPSRHEGFGFPPLEAMAAGTPAVVAASGSLPEVVGDAALIAGADDPAAWAAAITAIQDEATRARLIDAGLAHSATFTWARAAARTLAIYDEVLAAGA